MSNDGKYAGIDPLLAEADDLTERLGESERRIEQFRANERYARWMEEKMLSTLLDHAEAMRLLLQAVGVDIRKEAGT